MTSAPPPAAAARNPRLLVKVCGATNDEDVRAAREGGADLVGLWWSVPDGSHELDAHAWRRLATSAASDGPPACLVTFSHDSHAIANMVLATGCRAVQLHALQPPAMVRALRGLIGPEVLLLKALHVSGQTCLDERFAPAYAAAGADLFLLDRTSAGRVGSTGRPIAAEVALRVAGRLPRPMILAGGLTAAISPDQAALTSHPAFRGIDVDTAARREGRLDAALIASIIRGWRAAVQMELKNA